MRWAQQAPGLYFSTIPTSLYPRSGTSWGSLFRAEVIHLRPDPPAVALTMSGGARLKERGVSLRQRERGWGRGA